MEDSANSLSTFKQFIQNIVWVIGSELLRTSEGYAMLAGKSQSSSSITLFYLAISMTHWLLLETSFQVPLLSSWVPSVMRSALF